MPQFDSIQEREFARLEFIDPEILWQRGESTVKAILNKEPSVSHLTGTESKKLLESHHAACFAMMFPYSTGKISLCMVEHADFDCVLRGVDRDGKVAYRPVQLKQLVNHQFSAHADFQAEIDKLKKYDSGLAVCFWVNRDVKINMSELRLDGLRIGQLWIIGGSPDGDWMVHGGTLQDLRAGKFLKAVMKGGLGRPIHSQGKFKPFQTPANPRR